MREAILGGMMRAEDIVMRVCVMWGRGERGRGERGLGEREDELGGEEISGV